MGILPWGGGVDKGQKDRDALENEYNREEMDARVAVRACETLVRRCIELALILKAGGRALRGTLEKDPAYTPFLKNLGEKDIHS